MERREEYQILIDQYLLDTMSSEDVGAFLDRCAQDEALAEQLADTKMAMQAIDVAGDQLLLKHLQQLEATMPAVMTATTSESASQPEAKVVPLKPKRNWLSIAATVLLVVAASYFLLRPVSLTNQDLFAEVFTPFGNTELLDRGSVDDRQEAYFAYQAGNYPEAYELLVALPPDPGNHFFAAQAALESGQAEKAIPLLTPLAKNSDFVLQQEAEWSLALAHLSLDQMEEVRPRLQAISRVIGHPHQSDATTLLTRIR